MVPLALLPTWLAAALWTGASVGALAAAVVLVRRALDRPAPGWLVALVTGGGDRPGAGVAEPRVRTGQRAADAGGAGRPGRAGTALVRRAGRHRGGGEADPAGVRRAAGAGRTSYGCGPGGCWPSPAPSRSGSWWCRASSATYWTDGLIDAGRVGPPALAHNQSVYGALTRLLDGPPPTLLWLAVAGPLALAVLLVGAGWWRRGDRVLGTCLGALAMLLASPISWSHHWVWAVPVALVLWERSRWAGAAWTAVFVARPIVWPPYGQEPRVRVEPVRPPRRQRLPARRPGAVRLGGGRPHAQDPGTGVVWARAIRQAPWSSTAT